MARRRGRLMTRVRPGSVLARILVGAEAAAVVSTGHDGAHTSARHDVGRHHRPARGVAETIGALPTAGEVDQMVFQIHGVFLPDETVRDAWVVDGRLTFEAPATRDVTTLARDAWVIPGLVDVHCHIGIAPTGNVEDKDFQLVQAWQDRDAGTLLIRDAGSPVDTRWLQERDDVPHLIRAGRHIARSRRYLRNQGVEVDPDDLLTEVRTQVANSDGWVKIVIDWIDRGQGDLTPTFPFETLQGAVEEAHRLGARVAVHTFGEEAFEYAVAIGVDSIEHGTGLADDLIPAMVEKQISMVPTLINIDHFNAIAANGEKKYPTYAGHMRDLYKTSRERVRTAWEAGVEIFVGTDAGGILPHGLIRQEIAALVGAGLPLSYVLGQASWRAREWLGVPGLQEGAWADALIFDVDPRQDLSVMYRPLVRMLRGQLHP